MNRYFGINSPLGQVFSCLLLAVFVFLGLVPTGFMPDIGQKSGSFITICSGLDTREIRLDDQGNPIQSHMPSGEICTFAAANPMSIDVAIPHVRLPQPDTLKNDNTPPVTPKTLRITAAAHARAPPVA